MTAATFKKAGVDQSLSWNTTVPIKSRPIMLYLFDASRSRGANYESAKDYEVRVFPHKSVVKLSEKFICEKLCFKNELAKTYKGREMLAPVQRELVKVPFKKRRTEVVFLSWKGDVLARVKGARSPGKFAQLMKLALKKNRDLIEKAAARAKARAVAPKPAR